MVAVPHLLLVQVTLLTTLHMTGTVEECPPWFTLERSNSSLFPQCVCSDVMEANIICGQRKQRSYLQLGYCAFHNSATNETVAAPCPYVFPDHLIVDNFIALPRKRNKLNPFICGNLNRDIGPSLCGRCTNGTGPSIYSAGSQCVSCSAVNIVYYLLLQYLPTTVLFVIIIVFRINITSAPMAHYVLFCDSIVLFFRSTVGTYVNTVQTGHIYISILGKLVLSLNTIWSLDPLYFVSPPLCVSEDMEEIYIPFLETVATLYPFILLVLTYISIELHAHDFKPAVYVWRLIHRPYVRCRRTWDPNASVIQAFATLFFLSYTKLIILIYEALVPSIIINEEGSIVGRVTYMDPTVALFSRKHYYLISLSILILVIFILPPLLLLIVFPTCLFKTISRYLKPRWIISIQTFVDTFHGCYKDGTNGTRDYRAVSGYTLAVWAFFPAVAITANVHQEDEADIALHLFILFFIALTVTCALLKPYKHKAANISGVVLPAILAIAIIFLVLPLGGITAMIIRRVLISLPHCVFYGYIVYRLGKLLKGRCCKTQQMEDSVHKRLLCRPANTADYSQLNTAT